MAKKIEMTPELQGALAAFLTIMNAQLVAHTAKHYANLTPDRLVPEEGLRYVRVWSHNDRDGESRGSAYAFIDKTNGDILKPDGWKKPAKGYRGNLLKGDWLTACGPYGVKYNTGYAGTKFAATDKAAIEIARDALVSGRVETAAKIMVTFIEGAPTATTEAKPVT